MCDRVRLTRHDDDHLLEQLRNGCPYALAEIERRYGPAMRRRAARLLAGTGHDADDVVQDALMRAWTRLRTDDRETDLAGWLHTVVRNRALDLRRSAASRTAPLDERHAAASADPHRQLLRREAVRQLTGAIGRLPERQRDVVVRHALGGEAHASIARDLRASEGASKGLLLRARGRLREACTVCD